MKNRIFYLLALISFVVNAQVTPVGNLAFSNAAVGFVDIALDNFTPYVAFVDTSIGNKVKVMKFVKNNWQDVGKEVSTGDANFSNIEFIGSQAHVGYIDKNAGGAVVVKRLEDNSWLTVGNLKTSANSTYLTMSEIDGILYIAYADTQYGGKATVQKWNGNSWQIVGNGGFTNEVTSYMSLNKNKAGNIELDYFVPMSPGKVSAMEFDNLWSEVITPEFDIKNSYEISYDHDIESYRYIVYQDPTNDYKASVVKFDNPDDLSNHSEYFVEGLELFLNSNRSIEVNFSEYRVEVINMYGKQVENKNLNAGIYIVKAKNNQEGLHLTKFLVM